MECDSRQTEIARDAPCVLSNRTMCAVKTEPCGHVTLGCFDKHGSVLNVRTAVFLSERTKNSNNTHRHRHTTTTKMISKRHIGRRGRSWTKLLPAKRAKARPSTNKSSPEQPVGETAPVPPPVTQIQNLHLCQEEQQVMRAVQSWSPEAIDTVVRLCTEHRKQEEALKGSLGKSSRREQRGHL